MIFWIVVILMVIAITLGFIFGEWFDILATIGAFSFVVAVIMLIFVITNNIGPDAKIAKYQVRYDSLVYQYENDIYDNDNDLGKRDLMEDIEEWNTDLAYHKRIQRNFWVGIFYPNIYDYFDFIELR